MPCNRLNNLRLNRFRCDDSFRPAISIEHGRLQAGERKPLNDAGGDRPHQNSEERRHAVWEKLDARFHFRFPMVKNDRRINMFPVDFFEAHQRFDG